MSNINKAVLVTGSAGGIGQSICKKLIEMNYHVIGVDIDEQQSSYCSSCIQLDLQTLIDNEKAMHQFETRVLELIADNQLTGLINNAAIQIPEALDSISIQNFQKSMQVNVVVPLLLTSLFKHSLIDSKGSIVNIGSIHSRLSKSGFISYATSKTALAGLTRSLAIELAPYQVMVNCVEPAAIDTDMLRTGFNGDNEKLAELNAMHPVHRIGQPEEIAELVAFLIDSKATFMTGATIPIDGAIGARLHDPD